MSEPALSEPVLRGGSASDRQIILQKHQKYLVANAEFDWVTLHDQLWSASPDSVFFNLNGHTYRGRDQWVRLWKFYKDQLTSGYWTPYDIGGVVTDDMATVWCHRKTKVAWVGSTPRPDGKAHEDRSMISRSTMVFQKEAGDWRVVHVHFSEHTDTPRPGGI
ncbi:MAG: hypothetical protein QOD09_5040 [Bradyrhizobium sp.]|nr:hypothetical protein [Bradyrhizobium sp.]